MENNKEQKKYPWLQQLLTSILGTAIGVGLTFTVNRCVDSHKQQDAQRETAIMAVCDIDEIVQGLKDDIQLEDSLFKVAMYVSTHQELIDSLPLDTLNMAFEYLYDNPMVAYGWMADTKENAFNSGIDARMNLGNNKFYDNVQLCYYWRRSLIKVMEDAPVFRRPVSKEYYEELLQQLNPSDIDYDGNTVPHARRWVMKQIFAQESTTLYIKRYFSRFSSYRQVANEMERLNRENKLLMNITDEDIEAYIKRNSDNVSQQASADQLIGKWEMASADTPQSIVFHEDGTVENTVKMEAKMQVVLETEQQEVFMLIPMTFYMKGRWELKGDTLITDYDTKTAELLSFDFDTSSFPQSALERLKDSLEIKKEMGKQSFIEQFRQQTFKFINIIAFDKSGNTMVWTSAETLAKGAKRAPSTQLHRKPE